MNTYNYSEHQTLNANLLFPDANNGHPKTKKLLVNRNIRDVEHLKEEITDIIKPSNGAVRNIYTPLGGTEVTTLDQIENHKDYVAGVGHSNFKKIKRTLSLNRVISLEDKKSSEGEEGPPSPKQTKPKRISLIERQNLIAQKAKQSNSSSSVNSLDPSPTISKRSTPTRSGHF